MSPSHLARTLLAARKKNLSAGALHALATLADHEGSLPLTYVADALGISTAATTGLADRLEKQAFVARRHSTTDRRTIYLDITDAGTAVLDAILQAVPA